MMDDKRFVWALLFLLVFSLFSFVVVARPPAQLCCASVSDCVLANICVGSGDVSWDVDLDGDKDYCLDSKWYDCGISGTIGCDFVDTKVGPVAAYCDGNLHDCVEKKSDCSACGGDYECLNNKCIGGICRTVTSETGALCSDKIDNDCDGTADCGTALYPTADTDCSCCGGENAVCCAGDTCNSGLYCSKVNPTYLTPVVNGPHCCPTGFWWDATFCREYSTCNPECVSNPFNDACVSSNDLFGCCSFEGGGDTYQVITTY